MMQIQRVKTTPTAPGTSPKRTPRERAWTSGDILDVGLQPQAVNKPPFLDRLEPADLFELCLMKTQFLRSKVIRKPMPAR